MSFHPGAFGRIADETPSMEFAEWFVLSQTFLPALLYLPGSQPLRVPIRMACYGITLGALVYYWQNRKRLRPHPAVPWLTASMAYLAIMMAHPTTNSLASGLAQIGIFFSVCSCDLGSKARRKPCATGTSLWLSLICSGLSSVVGVLQVYDPTGGCLPSSRPAIQNSASPL